MTPSATPGCQTQYSPNDLVWYYDAADPDDQFERLFKLLIEDPATCSWTVEDVLDTSNTYIGLPESLMMNQNAGPVYPIHNGDEIFVERNLGVITSGQETTAYLGTINEFGNLIYTDSQGQEQNVDQNQLGSWDAGSNPRYYMGKDVYATHYTGTYSGPKQAGILGDYGGNDCSYGIDTDQFFEGSQITIKGITSDCKYQTKFIGDDLNDYWTLFLRQECVFMDANGTCSDSTPGGGGSYDGGGGSYDGGGGSSDGGGGSYDGGGGSCAWDPDGAWPMMYIPAGGTDSYYIGGSFDWSDSSSCTYDISYYDNDDGYENYKYGVTADELS